MKLQDGMVVKRKDNGLTGVAHKMEGKMWKVKYHDGTHTYTTESAFKNHFVIPELEVNFEYSKCDGVEPEQEKSIEYLNPSDDVVTKHLEKVAHKIHSDLIDNQEHYTNNGIQPIEIMKANMSEEQYYGFLLGNLQKYISRHEKKNKVEDLKKAKTYLTWMIEEWENGRKQ
ncbi:nucleotide kinase [Enterococcus phage vB_EfaS_9592-1]|uniref:DUF3310 domain-containing protein n=1 Tax=Enterococcus phage vB_EfaS_AL3 TaxID=2175687 RepID=A0A2S1PF73_9CAUD|nr:nucleotide kinase [Enterococcus phage vB_EfaS_AL3]AWH15214.1 hypothetical protein vBEfaSAL3_37 [Enterococcus phage vB_EfaS_AL3]WJJ54356.1 nucleotide kinase [Enterococcus phage vB_EfaS_9592-1]